MNQAVFEVLYRVSHESRFLDAAIIGLGKYLGYAMIAGALLLLMKVRPWKARYIAAAYMVLATVLARGIISPLVHFFYIHPRPAELLGITPLFSADGNSFPSGHAALFFALAMSIYYLNRKIGFFFLGLALIMGIARVIAGVHWPLDVVGGIVIGILSGMVVRILLRPHHEKGDSA